jgi:hypothetical protein
VNDNDWMKKFNRGRPANKPGCVMLLPLLVAFLVVLNQAL